MYNRETHRPCARGLFLFSVRLPAIGRYEVVRSLGREVSKATDRFSGRLVGTVRRAIHGFSSGRGIEPCFGFRSAPPRLLVLSLSLKSISRSDSQLMGVRAPDPALPKGQYSPVPWHWGFGPSPMKEMVPTVVPLQPLHL